MIAKPIKTLESDDQVFDNQSYPNPWAIHSKFLSSENRFGIKQERKSINYLLSISHDIRDLFVFPLHDILQFLKEKINH